MMHDIEDEVTMDTYEKFFSAERHGHDMRMTLDRLLAPDNAHPLVRDLLESIRECRLGEAQLALALLQTQLDVDSIDFQQHLSFLLFANAAHSAEPATVFQYLLNVGLTPSRCATAMIEHLVLGQYFSDTSRSKQLIAWFATHGGLVVPESRAAWHALETNFPEEFSANLSRLEAQKLDAYIRSQSLEVREMNRL